MKPGIDGIDWMTSPTYGCRPPSGSPLVTVITRAPAAISTHIANVQSFFMRMLSLLRAMDPISNGFRISLPEPLQQFHRAFLVCLWRRLRFVTRVVRPAGADDLPKVSRNSDVK